MAKKKAKVKQQFLSPERFIKERMRSVEIGDCFVSDDIFKIGYGNVVVARKHTGGNVSFGVFLVDTWCLGVKDCSYRLRVDEQEYGSIAEKCLENGMRKATYDEVHNIIYGAIAYAEEAGIAPCRAFSLIQYFLEDDTEDVPLIEYNFGKDGKHYLVVSSIFEANSYLPLLEKNLGDDFDWIIQKDDDADTDSTNNDDELDEFYDYNSRSYTYKNDNLPTEVKLENRGLFRILSLKKNRLYLLEEDIDKILAMPHDSLKRDLEQIILYGLRVIRDEGNSVRKYNTYINAIPHAVALLSVVGDSTASLDATLETLKVDLCTYSELYGEGETFYLFPALIQLGKDALPKLESFLYEKKFNISQKVNVFEAFVNIAYRWEDKRAEVIEILRKFLVRAMNDGTKSEITDYHLNGMLVWSLYDLRAAQLMPIIERMYKEDLVDISIVGTIDEVRKGIRKDVEFYPYEIDIKKCYVQAKRAFEGI